MTSRQSKRYLTVLVILIANILSLSSQAALNVNSVYSIPYIRSYLPELAEKSLGCQYNIAYSSFTTPDGLRDAALIALNPQQYGGLRCQPKQFYIKVFGYAQNYDLLRDASSTVQSIKNSLNGRGRVSIIVDWKLIDGNLEGAAAFLDQFLEQLDRVKLTAYLKVPASYLCKIVSGKPYILSLKHASRIIVEMYGENVSAYKTINQIFLSQSSEEEVSAQYPQLNCPRFPSYNLLSRSYPNIEFFIEKTLFQEQHGYIGDQFEEMIKTMTGIYNKKVFYDAYPPHIIRL